VSVVSDYGSELVRPGIAQDEALRRFYSTKRAPRRAPAPAAAPVRSALARARSEVRQAEANTSDLVLPSGPDISELVSDYALWQESWVGAPLGHGFPSGVPVREDGESHLEAWKRLLRADPCSYCGAPISATVDHVTPKSARTRYVERWTNFTGACKSCNGSKRDTPLLLWLRARAKRSDRARRRPQRAS
jgi:hypothetical protein